MYPHLVFLVILHKICSDTILFIFFNFCFGRVTGFGKFFDPRIFLISFLFMVLFLVVFSGF
jgi:hypothetical protein